MIDKDLRAHLLLNSDITSHVGTGVYARRLPQSTKTSSIVFDVAAGFAQAQIGSLESVKAYNVTLSVYSPKYSELCELSEHVVQHLNGVSGNMGTSQVTGCYVNSVIGTYEEEQKLYLNIIMITIYTN